MNKKLKIKDLVTIGIFFVIFFILLFMVGLMGLIPILFMFYPFTLGIVGGTVVMLLMAKVPKPWALFIFGMLAPMIMFAMGHTYIVPLISLFVVGLAEFIFRKGGYKSFKHNALAYATFSCLTVTSHLQMLLVKEKYKELTLSTGMSPEYFASIEKLITWQNMIFITIGAFVGGLIGAFIGKKMLKKHFEKAGIV